MKIDDQVRQGMAVRKILLVRHVGAEPASGETRLRVEADVALGAQNLSGLEYVSLRDQQIDIAGIAQGRILKGGDRQRNAFEDPEVDLLLAK